MKKVIIEIYKDGDEAEINKLFNATFKQSRDLKEWEWKFKGCPNDSQKFIILAKDNDKIVGQYSSIGYDLKYKDNILKMAQPVDIIVHEDYRGGIKGVLVEMFLKEEEKFRENGIDLIFGFPTREHYIFGKRILKYVDLIKIENLFKRLSWRSPFKNRFRLKVIYHLGGWVSRAIIRLFMILSLKSLKGVQYRWVDTFDERVDSFWKIIQEQYDIWVVRNFNYLDWRYCKKPNDDYHILIAERDRSIIGFIIVKYEDHGDIRIGFIMENLAIKEIHLLENLIKRGLLFLIRNKVDHAFVRLSNGDPIKDIFNKIGFTPKEFEFGSNFVYKKYSSDIKDSYLQNPSLWHLSFGDCDSL